ncbi:hypothetical protein SAMN06269185_3280 [Natronoarchaeum philippinense]|uniref:Uncharacterized protein n=1 Tax=Natronoarchaeum philippinense TaxID=558529 RepID=A0A285PA98_NATPI|nr:hypothetical protein [Natronoarchaeum philippinense]SNZ18177.1 hypothetical protein SAMN06269185_3280 [Natronoarchaeum philippinense]
MDVAEYTPQELARLQLGFIIREQPQQNADHSGTHASSRKRELQRGQQKARQEMLDDLGVEA